MWYPSLLPWKENKLLFLQVFLTFCNTSTHLLHLPQSLWGKTHVRSITPSPLYSPFLAFWHLLPFFCLYWTSRPRTHMHCGWWCAFTHSLPMTMCWAPRWGACREKKIKYIHHFGPLNNLQWAHGRISFFQSPEENFTILFLTPCMHSDFWSLSALLGFTQAFCT